MSVCTAMLYKWSYWEGLHGKCKYPIRVVQRVHDGLGEGFKGHVFQA